MSEQDNQKPKLMLHHGKPVTRRDFLSSGIIAGSAWVVMPSVLGMITKVADARAADCPTVAVAAGLTPFLVFDMSGGSALHGNWVPLDSGGQLLTSYSQMGLGAPGSLNVDARFGAPMATQAVLNGTTQGNPGANQYVSKIFEGIVANAQASTQANVRFGMLHHSGDSDSSNNQHNAAMQMARAGYQGSLIRGGLGTSNSNSGGNSPVPYFDASLKPLRVGSFNDLNGALGYGNAFTGMTKPQLDALAKANENLSASQRASLAALPLGAQWGELVRCGFVKNKDYTGPVAGVDPRQDPIFQAVYGIATNTNPNDARVVRATIVMNVLKGQSGPGTIQIGGCDYHSGNQTDGDAKDLEVGVEIGRAMECAARMGKPLIVQVITDGGIFSANNSRNWQGDSNEKSMTAMGVYLPNRVPRQTKLQVGHYNATMNSQGAAGNTVIGNDVKKACHAVVANALSIAGRMDLFPQITSRQEFDPVNLDEVLMFS